MARVRSEPSFSVSASLTMHDVGLDEDADDDKPPNNTDADEADECGLGP